MGNSYISLKTNGINNYSYIFKSFCDSQIIECSNIQIWENPKNIKNIFDIELGTDNNNIIVRFNNNNDFAVFECSKTKINNLIKRIRGF